jgi:glutaminase A-like protein
MIIMAAAYMRAAPGTTALVYLQANYRWLKRWADYLVATLPDPGLQNQTDDFAGKIAHSVNLALKGIVAVAAMGQIAHGCGEHADAIHFRNKARRLIAYWLKHSQAPGHRHLGLTYRRPGRRNRAWGTTYNAYPDALLGTGLVPDSVAAEQAAFYRTKINRFGLPLQTPHRYGKTDWEMWLSAWLHRHPIGQELIEREYRYANTTRSRVPFCDLYSTISGHQVYGFQARPVQGGIFALLALHALEGRRA